MKKTEMHRLALLGLTAGIIALSQNSLEGFENHQSIDMNLLIAKPSCKNSDSCGSATELAPKIGSSTSTKDEVEADHEDSKTAKDKKIAKDKKDAGDKKNDGEKKDATEAKVDKESAKK